MLEHTEKRCNANISWFTLIVILSAFLTTVTVLAAPGDLVIPRKEGADMGVDIMPASDFPHWVHRLRYRCDACHDGLFEMKLGATEISKELMRQNLSCATCHDGKIAFSVGFDTCKRCHAGTEK